MYEPHVNFVIFFCNFFLFFLVSIKSSPLDQSHEQPLKEDFMCVLKNRCVIVGMYSFYGGLAMSTLLLREPVKNVLADFVR